MTHWLYVDKTHPNQLKQKNLLKGQRDVLEYSKAGMQLSQEQMGTTRVCLCVCFIFLSFCSLASSGFLILLEKTSFPTAFEFKCYSCDSPEIFIFVSVCATLPTPFSLSPFLQWEKKRLWFINLGQLPTPRPITHGHGIPELYTTEQGCIELSGYDHVYGAGVGGVHCTCVGLQRYI